MAPTEVGRHCTTCQTQVVNFTRMTDGEVVGFLRQYNPNRRCGRFREDQVSRPLVAAKPVTGGRRWAMATVLLLESVLGTKARAQGEKPGYNARAMVPAATSPTHSPIPDSLFLVQGVVRNRWGVRKKGARVTITGTSIGLQDTTNAQGYFRLLLPKRKLGTSWHISVKYWNPRKEGRRLMAWVHFDPTRTKPYHITLKKPPVMRNPGFF